MKAVAVAVGGGAACLSFALVALALGGGHSARRTSLLQAAGAVRYYYVPASEARALLAQQQQQQQQLSSAHYPAASTLGPGSPEIKKAVTRTQLPSNFHWGTSGHGLDPEWHCTVSNMIALYNFVQPEWEKCKSNPNYIEPNFNATGNETEADDEGEEGGDVEETAEEGVPSALRWAYTSLEGHDITPRDVAALRTQKDRFISHLLSGPSAADEIEGYFDGKHSRRLLQHAAQARKQQLANWDKAPVLDESAPTMKQCLDFALGNLCVLPPSNPQSTLNPPL